MDNAEEWKVIDRYEKYKVSNKGRVMSLTSYRKGEEMIMKQPINGNGYRKLNLLKKGKRKNMLVHRLVAFAFLDNPDNKKWVKHIDGNRLNNRVDNLLWF